MTNPTPEGLKRYQATAGYNATTVDPIPCVCIPSCPTRCAGECGCEACAVQFAEFCADAGFHDPAQFSEEAGSALAAYRGVADTSPQAIIHRRRFDGR